MDFKYYEVRSLAAQTSYKIDFRIYAHTRLMVAITNSGKLIEAYGARSREGAQYHDSVYEILHKLEDQVRKQFFDNHKLTDVQIVEDHTEYLAFQYKGCYQMSSRDYALFYEFVESNTQSDHE